MHVDDDMLDQIADDDLPVLDEQPGGSVEKPVNASVHRDILSYLEIEADEDFVDTGRRKEVT